MATYPELHRLSKDQNLLDRIKVALWVTVHAIAAEGPVTNHAARIGWANTVVTQGRFDATAKECLALALAQNKALTVSQIEGVTDAALQTVVDGLVNLLANITA